jgi:hypothetical protein
MKVSNGSETDRDENREATRRAALGTLAGEQAEREGRLPAMPSAPWFKVFGGDRRNDHHTTLAEKHAACAKAAE